MKKIKQLCILFLIVGIWSCDTSNMFIGGGIAPDISAPELFITSPANLAYESGSFVIAGTATDNIKVTKVLLTVYRNGSLVFDRDNSPQASISGTQWSYRFSNLESGEYTITATAYDKAGNLSENSSKSIVVTVDNEPSTISIQRPNLKPQKTLETLDYRDYSHIEYFQNKTFSVRGSVDDEYPLKEITLQLLKETECVYSLTFDSKFSGNKEIASMVEGSLYNWTVTIDSTQKVVESEKYINKLASLSSTEKHYLKLAVIVTDKAGNKTADSNSVQGFICLYQEADRPWAVVSSLAAADTFELQQENNKLRSGAQITGSAYDDDLLDTLEFCIMNTDYDELVKYETIEKASFGDTGCTVWSLTAPANQGRYRLYYRLKDNSGTVSYGNSSSDWTKISGWDDEHSIGFQVIDESAPVTEMAAFESYPTTAYVKENNPAFIIEGTTRDTAGISQIILAWDPNADEEKAASLRKEKWNITENGYYDGVKYWLVDLSNFENVPENNTFKMAWSCELPISDFVLADGTPVFNYKKMYYCTVSSSENYAVGTFTIPKEFDEPKLTITLPKDNETCRNVEGDRFTIAGTCEDVESGVASLIIKYKKSSGDEAEYDVLKGGKLAADGSWSVTSDLLAGLGGSYQRIIVEARDYFGNISRSSIFVVVDDNSPQVASISTEQDGGYYSFGQTLNFIVTMNREVEVNGNGLMLELNCAVDVNGKPVYALYKGIENNKVLKFEYTVKEGDSAEPLDYVSADSLKLLDGTTVTGKATDSGASVVPAALSLPTPGESGSLASRGIFIDTEKPYVKQITADVGEGAYKADTVIKISAQFNENISGRAKILLNSREKAANNYVQMADSVIDTDTLEFIYTVKDGDNTEALDIFAPFYAYSESVTVKDAAGNEMDFNNFPQNSESGSLASLKIKVDTTAPQIKGVYVSDVSTKPYSDGKHYLNTGKTVTLEAEFSEAIMLGSNLPYLVLNALNGSSNVQAQYKSGAGTSILSFVYTVVNGDNSAADLACTAFKGDVKDIAGNAVSGSVNGENQISGTLKKVTRANSASYSDISIIIDTDKPQPPTFEFAYTTGGSITDFTKNGNVYTGKSTGYIENITAAAKAASSETTAVMKIFASVGGQTKQDWKEQSEFSTTTDNAEESWIVKAQLVDYAGNTSDISSASFMIDKGVPQLSAINTTLTSGLYKAGTSVPVTLVFSKKVNAVKSGSEDITVNFNNGGKAVISSAAGYLTLHKGTYTVGNNSDVDTEKLQVESISGGNFSDSAGNLTAKTGEYGIITSKGFADDFKVKTIQIDTAPPLITGYSIESISDKTHYDSDNYYLNAEKNVKIAVNFNEPVMIGGDSSIKLSHDKNATYTGTSSDKKTLYYTYSVVSGDNSAELSINANIYPNNVQDVAGNALAGGLSDKSVLNFAGKKIVIDTAAPTVPDVKIYKGTTEISGSMDFSEQVTLKVSGEAGAQISYSVNGGAEYNAYKSDVVLGDTGSKKTYYIVARQTDKAGNMSSTSTKITVTVDLQEMGISKITTTKVDGTYKAGDTIPIILLFTKKVSYSGLNIELTSGAKIENLSSSAAALSHQIDYVVVAGNGCTQPLKVSTFAGTFKDESGNSVNDKITKSFNALADNFKDNEIYIDTTAPSLVSYSVIEISDTEHSDGSNYYLNAEDTVKLEVTFSEIVTGIGSSVLPLNSGESAVYSDGYGTNTLTYEYKIQSGNASALQVNANVYPTNIQDAAGNELTTGLGSAVPLKYINKNIVVDTVLPAAPVVKINGSTSGTAFSAVDIAKMEITGENNAVIQYSADAGSTFTKYSAQVSLPTANNKSLNIYRIMAKQTDLAGNESALSALKTVTVDLRPIGIKAISTTKPGGVYKAGAVIPLTVEFYKAVTSDGDIILTLSNDADVKFKASGKSVYTVNYTVAAGDNSDTALYMKAISGKIKDTITGNYVSSFEGIVNGTTVSGGSVNGNIADSTTNLAKTGSNVVAIDTIVPQITGYSIRTISDENHSDSSNYYLNSGDSAEISVTFSEAVTINGDSTVTLSNGKKAEYSGTSNDKKTLYYNYTVGSSGDNSTALSINANIYPNNVQDAAGNALASGLAAATALKHNSKSIVVDIDCAAPALSGIVAGKIYNSTQKVTLTGESGAVFYYSYDGGATETKLASENSFNTPADDGRYQITAYQIDIAGNKSVWAKSLEIIVDTAPPKIKSISTTAGDGIYKAGDTLTITAEFSESVTGSITAVLSSGASVKLDASGSSASVVYRVATEENTSVLSVDSVSGSIKDDAGNVVTSFSGYSNFAGKKIEIDTVAPKITKYRVTKFKGSEDSANAGKLIQDVAVDSKIVLQFNEKVSKGSGTIKVERIYKSYPAVMEADEYNTHKAGISQYYIQRCIGTVNNAGAEPDTNAKYVLKYAIDHGAYKSNSGLSGDQLKVYNYFADKDYNVTEIDVNSGLVTETLDAGTASYSIVTINIPSELKKGILYKLTFTAGAFVDQAGNLCTAETGNSVQFETGPTATPVIRINKLSGRESGAQPYTTTVKISSEMVHESYTFGGTTYTGATLSVGQNSNTSTTSGVKNTPNSSNVQLSAASGAQTTVTLNAGSNGTAAIFKVWAKVEKTNLTAGDISKELAYKTVIKSTWTDCYVRGSDSSGGVSATTEFPTNWYTSEQTARLTGNYLVSWHILKDFQWKMVGTNGNWSTASNQKSYPGSYGYYSGS